jgi:hypothetical protein
MDFGAQGSPIQFFVTLYFALIAVIADTAVNRATMQLIALIGK